MSPELASLIDSLLPEEQQAIELWIRRLKQHPPDGSATGAEKLKLLANQPIRPFPLGAGADDPLVRGTPAEQEELWRAMTDDEVDEFYEGRY